MHTTSQNTLAQSWGRGAILAACILIPSLHLLVNNFIVHIDNPGNLITHRTLSLQVFFAGALFSPELFHSSELEGSICCHSERSVDDPTWDGRTGGCVPIDEGEQVPLATAVVSFRFPRDRDEVASYSR